MTTPFAFYIPSSFAPYPGGNQSYGSVYEMLVDLASYKNIIPTAGGTLTINSQSLGSYDYTIFRGNQNLTSFTVGDWFTATEDSRSQMIVVDGDLTVDAAVTLIPSVRKLFTALYVTGNLTVNGSISMSLRGANHGATGSNVTAQDIRLYTGTIDSVLNPQVPAVGGALGGGRGPTGTIGVYDGNAGTAGTDGATGGGGGGQLRKTTGNGNSSSGDGAAGTAFSGGSGGGPAFHTTGSGTYNAGDAVANGGQGGSAGGNFVSGVLNGGAGNPRGAVTPSSGSSSEPDPTAEDGTGGVLFIAVGGNLLGSGTIIAKGGDAGSSASAGAGASGGGSVTVLCNTDASTVTVSAPGGVGEAGTAGGSGGNGGDGTARVLEGL